MSYPQYTPHEDVNQILSLLLKNVKEILRDDFLGMYLYGSLSSGDFNPETSDVDFLVVSSERLSQKTISELEAMHKQAWAGSLKRAGKLEGAYVHKELIRKHDPQGAACPTINEGRFYVAELGSDWIIQRHVVREYGVILEGPDPKTLIDFVTPSDIRTAVLGTLYEWWFPMLENPIWLQKHGIEYHAFAILTMCRALHSLETGTIVSKPEAARWAQKELGKEWSLVIDRALITRPDTQGLDLYNSAMDLIRFTKEQVSHPT